MLVLLYNFLFLALFRQYAEVIPGGQTCNALSQAAKSNQIYIVGGSIPEICDGKVYNTCTVWDPNGDLIAKHRKVLFIYVRRFHISSSFTVQLNYGD